MCLRCPAEVGEAAAPGSAYGQSARRRAAVWCWTRQQACTLSAQLCRCMMPWRTS